MFIDLERGQYLHEVLQNLKEADISIDSMEMSKPTIKGEGIAVHLVLHAKRIVNNEEVYGILMKSDKVLSVDFL